MLQALIMMVLWDLLAEVHVSGIRVAAIDESLRYFSPPFTGNNLRTPCWNDDQTERCLPGFFMIGNPKCGTTDMFLRLQEHPQLFPSFKKEPHFWTRDANNDTSSTMNTPSKFQQSVHLYIEKKLLFNSSTNDLRNPDKILFEGSASTFWDIGTYQPVTVPQVLRKVYGTWATKLKFLVMVRDPVERLWSDYRYFSNKKAESTHFDAMETRDMFHEIVVEDLKVLTSCLATNSEIDCILNYKRSGYRTHSRVQIGCYSVFFRSWFLQFPLEQFLVVRSESYFEKPQATVQTVFDFLQVSKPTESEWTSILRTISTEERRSSAPNATEHVGMRNDTRALLDRFYAPFNLQLRLIVHNIGRAKMHNTII
eukprot:m.264522 g.264522  ORF g.264522 m.264522 type:complete len:367 (-) comp56728_c0_seq1:98-1198(-)